MKTNRTPVGERICFQRRKLGFTQTQLSEKMGVSQQLVAFWENQAKAPTPEMLVKLAALFKVSVDELLLGDKAQTSKRGPTSRLEERFEAIAKLPRRQQERVISVVDALLAK